MSLKEVREAAAGVLLFLKKTEAAHKLMQGRFVLS